MFFILIEMNAWFIFLAIFGGFLVLVIIGYFVYYRNHKVSSESEPSQSYDELADAKEVTKKETFRERARKIILIRP
jgi:hypothetical protein